jgi:hypothetical protein
MLVTNSIAGSGTPIGFGKHTRSRTLAFLSLLVAPFVCQAPSLMGPQWTGLGPGEEVESTIFNLGRESTRKRLAYGRLLQKNVLETQVDIESLENEALHGRTNTPDVAVDVEFMPLLPDTGSTCAIDTKINI